MIAYLEGTLMFRDENSLVVKASGVGYELFCSSNTAEEFEEGAFVKVFVHTHVREDAFHLFGFSTLLEKQIFLSLIKVNGVGPKSAIQILSGARPEVISDWIETSNAKALAGLPKIGKKTAEQIILSLKGKLTVAVSTEAKKETSTRSDIISALVNLGFRLSDVERVVSKMDPKMDLNSGVREGLQALTN